MSKDATLRRIIDCGVVAVVRAPSGEMLVDVAQALLSERTDVVTVIHPWQQGDYATLGFRRMGPIRTLCSQAPDPVILSRLDLDALQRDAAGIDRQDLGFLRRFYIHRNPYRRYVAKWSALAGMARKEVA